RPQPRPGGGLPRAGAQVERFLRGHQASPGLGARARDPRAARGAAQRRVPGREEARPRPRLRLSALAPRGRLRAGAHARGGRRRAFSGAVGARRRGRAARAARANPPGTRPRLTEFPLMEAALRPAEATELESFSPLDGKRLGAVPTITPDQVQSVVDDVASVQPFWAQLPLTDRARYMRRAGQAIIDQIDELAELLSREQGKPLNESYVMELLPTIDSLRWLADAGPEILDDERIPLPIFLKQKRARFTYEPLGVVGVIAPWNYPWSIPFGEVAIALMAGNGVVLKPASLTPLIGQRIQEVFERAGLPEGLVRTVHGGGAVGQALVESTAAKIFFTGSVEVGRQVGIECAQRMKGSVLELGGKDAMIVCDDANLANAISGCLWGGFANAGQTCSGIERVYVVKDVAER